MTESTPRLSIIVPIHNGRDELAACLDALERARLPDGQDELIVVDDGSTDGAAGDGAPTAALARPRCDTFLRLDTNRGPSAARNAGARAARAPLLFFLDADVLVEPDSLTDVLAVFDADPTLAGTFCSYQHDTPHTDFVSQYKNLLHHYTHQQAAHEAATFCGGFGAMQREVFLSTGGFDEDRRAMEDVDLGYRATQAGHRIVVSPHIQMTHLKRYTLRGLVRSDVLMRAIPWTRIMLERRVFKSDLNLKGNHLTSVAVVGLMCALLPVAAWWPRLVLTAEVGLFLLFVALNAHWLAFARRMRGPIFALGVVAMTWLFNLYSGIGLVLGVSAHLMSGKDRRP